MTAGYKWKPLQRAARKAPAEELIAAWMATFAIDREAALARMEEEHAKAELWANDLYQVEVRRQPENDSAWLCIRRRDGYPGRDWRHFQQIKNELIGPECEAVELFPAESRLVDTSNKYHLYCCTAPTFRFPFGHEKRDVQFGDDALPGLRQRPPMQHKGGNR